MALTIAQLYEKYADRKPDPSGLEFWTKGFLGQGDTIIDANEEASFARAVAEARAQGTEPEATPVVSAPRSLLDANTSTAVDTPNYRQMVLDRYASIGRTGVGTGASNVDKEGLDAWTKALETGQIKPDDLSKTFQVAVNDYIATNPNDKYTKYVKNYLGLPNTTTATSPLNSTATLFEDTFGRKPTQDEINMFGDTVESRELDSFFGTARNEVVNTMPTTGAVGKMAKQILAQGTTSQWGGEGYGSTTKNAYDMAAMLASQGYKDINDFGKVAAYVPLQELYKTYNGQQVITTTDEEGKTVSYIRQPTGEYEYNYETGENRPATKFVPVPSDAKFESVYGLYDSNYDTVTPVDSSKIKTVDGQAVVDTGGTTFGNVKTGKAIESFYDKAGGNVWGGTFAGKDSTAYGVQFDAAGKPIFYSQYGGDSSDIGQLMPVIQLALAASGAGGALGGSLLGAGASQIATNALGNAILGAATTGLAGGDPLKGALLGGAGGALSGYLQGGPIDASNMTATQFNDALENQLIKSMQGAGLNNAQINQFLENASAADIASITSALPVVNASDNLLIEAARKPITANALIDTLSQVPNIVTTAPRPQQVSPDVINAVNALISGGNVAPQTIEIKDTRPKQTDIPVITTSTSPTGNTPTVTNPTISPPTTDLSTSDKLKVAQLGLAAAGLLGAGSALSSNTSGGVQYPIVDVPANWATPPRTSVAPATVLPPINFGDRNLLIGTQWEKFLDPNYGQVPEPIQYSQPSSLSYNDLMGILGSKQGMPLASTLSINDIISGIQNQYGQTRSSTMG
jgi:hypothetical protein